MPNYNKRESTMPCWSVYDGDTEIVGRVPSAYQADTIVANLNAAYKAGYDAPEPEEPPVDPPPVDPPPVEPQPIQGIKTAAELQTAMATLKGGETLLLAPGNFGVLTLTKAYASPVTLKAADASNRPVFSRFTFTNAKGFKLDRVNVKYESAAAADRSVKWNVLTDCANIEFLNCLLYGDDAHGHATAINGYGTGSGLQVKGGSNIVVDGCEFRDWFYAQLWGVGASGAVRNCYTHRCASDGIQMSRVNGFVVESNVFTNFRRPPGDTTHMDYIQSHTNGMTEPTFDVTIRNNFLNAGNSNATQGIFMRNESVDSQNGGARMYYRNILIENNVIMVNHYHGITSGETDGLVIRHNTVVRNPDGDPKFTGRIGPALACKNVTVQNNICGSLGTMTTGWNVSGNFAGRDEALIPYLKNPMAGNAAVLEDFRRLKTMGADIDRLPGAATAAN
jgi:hypothetical protein